MRADNALLAFEEVRKQLRAHARREGGMREVAIDQIVGSVGRYRDFDRAFLPRQLRTRDRWESIDLAHLEGVELPPIELYKIGEIYFVKDGNHRVSVARERGQVFVDARVIEVASPAPITSVEDLLDWIRNTDMLAFYAATRIGELRPDARIELTLPGQYEKLLEHISTHRLGVPTLVTRPSGHDAELLEGSPTLASIDPAEIARSIARLLDDPVALRAAAASAFRAARHWSWDEIVSGYAAERSERPLKRLGRAIRWRDPSR